MTGGIRRDDVAAIKRLLQSRIGPGELNGVVALVINELYQLHDGNIA